MHNDFTQPKTFYDVQPEIPAAHCVCGVCKRRGVEFKDIQGHKCFACDTATSKLEDLDYMHEPRRQAYVITYPTATCDLFEADMETYDLMRRDLEDVTGVRNEDYYQQERRMVG